MTTTQAPHLWPGPSSALACGSVSTAAEWARATGRVAPHGPALAHLLHAPSGGLIVEITHPGAVHPEYWGLAGLANWSYELVLGDAVATYRGAPPSVNSDFLADISAVLAKLQHDGMSQHPG